METGKTFVQVFIKSAEDLPETAGYYCIMRKKAGIPDIMYLCKKIVGWEGIDWYLKPISSNRERVIEVLKMVDKYHYCLDSEIELFASELEGVSEISQSCQKEVNSAENVISEVKELNCNNTCKWFKVGYGHCNFCSRKVNEHDCKDNYEPISEVSESTPKSEQRNKIEELMSIDEKDGMYELSKDRVKEIQNTELSEVNPVQSNVTDEEIPSDVITKMQKEFQPDTSTSFKQGMYSGYAFGLQDGFKYALRSRLQPAVAYNIGLQFSDNLVDLINCIKAYDKTAPLEEKGRYFEAIQRELEKIQPAVTDEQIEKWAEIASTRKEWDGFPTINLIAKRLRIEGAKAMRDGKIAEYIKNLK